MYMRTTNQQRSSYLLRAIYRDTDEEGFTIPTNLRKRTLTTIKKGWLHLIDSIITLH